MRVVVASLLIGLLLASSLAGCLGSPDDSGNFDDTPASLLDAPVWEVGDWWLYTFVTPEFGEDSARLVVTENNSEESAWILGISTLREAQRHTVINHNPFLGRMTWDNLSTYENGIPQPVFKFPFSGGNEWDFTLFGNDWTAQVTSIIEGRINVQAVAADGAEIIYTFDGHSGFLRTFNWIDTAGTVRLDMQLTDNGNGYTGDVWFIRATDLFDELYEGTDVELYDTFFDSGHPSNGDFDMLVWYLDVEIAGGVTQGTLSLKDHSGVTPLARTWGPDSTEKGSLGTIPSNSGEYSVTVTINGGSSHIYLKVAGGLQQQWTL